MKKFFIVGCPRSGTTMLQQALNRHSQIIIPPETKFFFSFFGHSQKRQSRHVERLNRDLHIRLPAPAKAIRTAPEGRAFYEIMAQQYAERVRKRGCVYFGEKTPEHSGQLPRIRECFPGAKILVLFRDGRDVASSLSRMPWMPSNLYVNFIVWLYYSRVLGAAVRAATANCYCVRYEDIVAAPQTQLAAILRFLELPYEPAVADGYGNHEGIPTREVAWKERALRPITTERVGIFRSELSDEQIELLERLGREALPALGYPLRTSGMRPLSLAFLFRLTFGLSRFCAQLPWQSMIQELCCRSFLELRPGTSARASFATATA
jgi:hypothetical protein